MAGRECIAAFPSDKAFFLRLKEIDGIAAPAGMLFYCATETDVRSAEHCSA